MSTHILEPVVRSITHALVAGDYDAVIAMCQDSRLTSDDLNNVIYDYGRTLVEPPSDSYPDLDAVIVKDAEPTRWSVRAPLWSKEEGRSDLTLELMITQDGERWIVELDDLHVL